MSATDCIAAWFAERWGWSHAVQLTDADELLRVLSDAGYHVAQEGQAVVVIFGDQVHQAMFVKPDDMRPLTQPPPVVDEMTTTKEGE